MKEGRERPGPASTEGERPPTNPAIRVQFPPEADGIFFRAVAGKMCDSDFIEFLPEKKRKRHLLDKSKSGL